MIENLFGDDIDPNYQLSPSFKVKDLIPTSTGYDNSPNEEEVERLKNLAQALEILKNALGNFRVASAFRSQAVNDAVGGSPTSRHRMGEAADIVPTSGNSFLYFRDLLKRDDLRNLFGEISLKKPQNAIHLTLPFYNSSGVFVHNRPELAEGSPLVYKSMTQAQINDFLVNPYGSGTGGVIQAGIPSFLKIMMGLTGLSFLVFSVRKRMESH